MRSWWWKILCFVLVSYAVVAGFLIPVPDRFILHETIRNLFFHVPMWFAMITLYAIAFFYSLKYLRTGNLLDDLYAVNFTNTGIFFSILGLVTGMEWAQYTWNSSPGTFAPWNNDPKQLDTALSMLIYFAYSILRSGLKDEEKRAKIGAVYNIFAFAMLIPLIFIMPRMQDSSLHPGASGNPALASDLDSTMQKVFFPAILGWILLSLWIASLYTRLSLIKFNKENAFHIHSEKK